LNCVANGRLLREGPFERLWIQPAAGDAGGAVGAALFVAHQLRGEPRVAVKQDHQQGSFLGPAFEPDEISAFLTNRGVESTAFPDEEILLDHASDLLAAGRVVGWFQGRMEFGPRALGARSILGDARSPRMQAIMNLKIKFRESFRPFAPVVLSEHAADWFDFEPDQESPYMLLVVPVRTDHWVPLTQAQRDLMDSDPDLRNRVNIPRSTIPAVTHVDYSARVQTVDSVRNPRLHALMQRFFVKTGCPVLVNTSFNVRGEPIVCSPADAYRCFMATEMDALVLGNHVVLKSTVAAADTAETREQYLAQFQLD
jgi:carbamoyltransferase